MDVLFYILLKNSLWSMIWAVLSLAAFLILVLQLDKKIEAPKFYILNRLSYKLLRHKYLYRKLLYHLKIADGVRTKISNKEYSARLQYIRNIILDRFNVNILVDNTPRKESQRIGLVIPALLLMLFPFIYFSHYLVPTGVDSLDILWFEVSSNGFKDLNTYYWFLLTKFTVLILLIIWFMTTNRWWRYGLLSPIILYTYQFIEALYDVHQLDAYGNLNVLPALIAIVLAIIGLSHLVRFNYGILDLYQSIESELDDLIDKVAKEELLELRKLEGLNKGTSLLLDREDQYRRLENLNNLKKQIIYKLKLNS